MVRVPLALKIDSDTKASELSSVPAGTPCLWPCLGAATAQKYCYVDEASGSGSARVVVFLTQKNGKRKQPTGGVGVPNVEFDLINTVRISLKLTLRVVLQADQLQ